MTSAAISSDGHYLLTGSDDATAILWEVSTGKALRILEGHTSAVTSVVFSADGRYALTGSADTTAILWEVSTGKALRILEGHTKAVTSVAFSPDGRTALTGSADTTAILWEWEVPPDQAMRTTTLTGHTGAVKKLIFSPDGRRILSASTDSTLILWDAQTGAALRTLRGQGGEIQSVVFSPDGQTARSSSVDGTVIVWDMTDDVMQRYIGHTSFVNSVAISPDGRTALSGSSDNTLILWDVASGQALRTFIGHTGAVTSVAISPDGRTALSGSLDNTLILWEMASGQALRTFTGHTDAVTSVAISPDGQTALSGSFDGRMILWDTASGQIISAHQGNDRSVTSVAFGPDGRIAFSGSADGRLIQWDTALDEPARTFGGRHSDAVLSIATSRDGALILTGSRDTTMILWNAQSGEPIRQFTGLAGAVNSVAFSQDSRMIISGSANQLVMLWDIDTGEVLKRYVGSRGPVNGVAFSPDGRSVLSAADISLILWRVEAGPDGLLEWTWYNRYIPEFTCEQRVTYLIDPLCSAEGIFVTRTPFPTLTPSATLDLTHTTATLSPTATLTSIATPTVTPTASTTINTPTSTPRLTYTPTETPIPNVTASITVSIEAAWTETTTPASPSAPAQISTPLSITTVAASATASPTNTPTPSATPGADIVTALAVADIAPESGFEAARRDQVVIDLTGLDTNTLLRQNLADDSYTNFALGAIIAWGPGALQDECGFAFRINADTGEFYVVSINREGKLAFQKQVNNQLSEPMFGDGSFISVGRDEANNMLIIILGNTFSVYLNGHYAAQFQDADYESGQMALAARTVASSQSGSSCTFSNAWAWSFAYSMPTPISPPTLTSPPTATITPLPSLIFRVINGPVKVRTAPSVNADIIGSLRTGSSIEVRSDSRTEADGYIWWKSDIGWSAERSSYSPEVFMVQEEALSASTFHFELLPVELTEMQWFQYYGNTVFAYEHGAEQNFDGYSQGLHGGIDLGSSGGVAVHAGVTGVLTYSGDQRGFQPYRVDITVGEYLIIYGHLSNTDLSLVGRVVTPETVVGYIDSGSQLVHIEIRRGNKILNPLEFMPEDMRNALMIRFPPVGEFYSSPDWTQWLTPLDQPEIIIGGPVIGPRAPQ